MRTLLAALVLLPAFALVPTFAAAQEAAPIRISLDARGEDAREVLATLFAQAKKPYALDAGISGKLYVKLDSLPYAKALDIVLLQAGLVAKERDGTVIVSLAPKPAAPKPVVSTVLPAAAVPSPTPTTKKAPVAAKPVAPAPVAAPAVTAATFAHKVTTRLNRAPLAKVFAAFAEQSGATIELDSAVPAYRVDAFFVKTSLKYALDRVCKAAGLKHTVESGKIKISVK